MEPQNMQQLELKEAFLNRYNPNRTIQQCVSSGLNAALGHNSLYSPNIGNDLKQQVRQEWSDYLLKLKDQYKSEQTVQIYYKSIEDLKKHMNERFAQKAFRLTPHPIYKTDPGFRISHAQKSISVFLKHLWCMGEIATPPQCPVDSIILGKVGLRYPDTKWGYVNSIEEHQKKIDFLQKAASNVPLAEWELANFNTDDVVKIVKIHLQ
jgi:hypothetical protein